tara:strand:+ start:241 stop:759 length:519 start_codon:yes stop_codon:yes gene_type:complete
MSTPTKKTACRSVILNLKNTETGEKSVCKFDVIFRNGVAFLETRQGDVAITGPPGSVSSSVPPEEGQTLQAELPPNTEVESVETDMPQGEGSVETQDGSSASSGGESTGQNVDGEPSEGASVKEDGTQGEGSKPPEEVCVLNPSEAAIPHKTRILISQDQEENWVVIWAECN